MQQFCQYGSVRGATGNRRPYRDDGFCGKCGGRSQELLALHPSGSGVSTPLERVGGLGIGGAERTTSQTG